MTFNDELVDQLLLDDVARFEAGNETESGGWCDAFVPARESSLSSSKSTLVPPGAPHATPGAPSIAPTLYPPNCSLATAGWLPAVGESYG